MRDLGVDPLVYKYEDLIFFYKSIILIVELPEIAMAWEEMTSRTHHNEFERYRPNPRMPSMQFRRLFPNPSLPCLGKHENPRNRKFCQFRGSCLELLRKLSAAAGSFLRLDGDLLAHRGKDDNI